MSDTILREDAAILPMVECKKCHFRWVPRTANPVACPECSCRDWRTWKDGKKKGEAS